MAQSLLKDILVKEGIKHGELANKSGLVPATITKFANGKRTPSPTSAYKILKALNNFPGISKQYGIGDVFPTID